MIEVNHEPRGNMELSKQQMAKLSPEVQQLIKSQAREIAEQKERTSKLVDSVYGKQIAAGTMLKTDPRVDKVASNANGETTYFKRTFHMFYLHNILDRAMLMRGLEILDFKESKGKVGLVQLDTPLSESNKYAQDPKDELGDKQAPTFWNDSNSKVKMQWFEDHEITSPENAYDRLHADESQRYVSVAQRAINAQKSANVA